MKKKLVSLLLTAVMAGTLVAGCGGSTGSASGTASAGAQQASGTASGAASGDLAAAQHVADLIDAIYVQERTDQADEQCKEAKEAWDALTDTQKALVSGDYADPDYFGRDTGDASADAPLNDDGIGENEILVVSFGTSFNDSRAKDIGGIEKAEQEAYPDYSVRRAFTAQIIINHVQARDGEKIDNVDQALQRAVENGVKNLIVQPTHLMHGAEYDELAASVKEYADKFDSVKIAEPLLGEAGSDTAAVNEDKQRVAKDITAQAVKDAGYDSLEDASGDGTAFVFMGHGTSHEANITYDQMQSEMEDLGYHNVFIGTVEGKPADTACQAVIQKVKDAGYKEVILRPLMVVAGDHANNDMAGDDAGSWKSQFEDAGFTVETQISGLGRIEDIEQMYVEHTKDAIDNGTPVTSDESADAGTLADGTYTADFNTDSSMFHVNDADNGKGTLTVKDGKMVIHIRLVSENIVNLYLGKASDAEKADKSDLIQPTEETVNYSDGTSETVYAFDVPVEAIGKDFDLAILGTKGTWYDHTVSVSDPVAQ